MGYLHISLKYRRIMAAGFLLTFFSGFGQSFFISSFTPRFLDAFDLDNASFGGIYASATLVSGLLLPWLGGRLDRVDPVRYTLVSVAGLAAACFTVAASRSLFVFALGLFGLRLFGQGLFSHISATIIAKRFRTYRGRALSLTALGYPAGEAVLPLFAILLVNVFGWRWAWATLGLALCLILLPLAPYLLSGSSEVADAEASSGSGGDVSAARGGVPEFAKSTRFWFLALGGVIPPFVLTALFLYHGTLAEARGWSLAWMASGFLAFAAARVTFSLLGGPWMDALGARRMFPYYLLPLGVGLAVLANPSSSLWIAPAYLFLAGVSVGLGGPLKTALWAEIYGLGQLGRIRSWTAALVVLSTAAGPPLLGLALDAGVELAQILRATAASVFAYSALCFVVRKRVEAGDQP